MSGNRLVVPLAGPAGRQAEVGASMNSESLSELMHRTPVHEGLCHGTLISGSSQLFQTSESLDNGLHLTAPTCEAQRDISSSCVQVFCECVVLG